MYSSIPHPAAKANGTDCTQVVASQVGSHLLNGRTVPIGLTERGAGGRWTIRIHFFSATHEKIQRVGIPILPPICPCITVGVGVCGNVGRQAGRQVVDCGVAGQSLTAHQGKRALDKPKTGYAAEWNSAQRLRRASRCPGLVSSSAPSCDLAMDAERGQAVASSVQTGRTVAVNTGRSAIATYTGSGLTEGQGGQRPKLCGLSMSSWIRQGAVAAGGRALQTTLGLASRADGLAAYLPPHLLSSPWLPASLAPFAAVRLPVSDAAAVGRRRRSETGECHDRSAHGWFVAVDNRCTQLRLGRACTGRPYDLYY